MQLCALGLAAAAFWATAVVILHLLYSSLAAHMFRTQHLPDLLRAFAGTSS
jgi:hypothetical protein